MNGNLAQQVANLAKVPQDNGDQMELRWVTSVERLDLLAGEAAGVVITIIDSGSHRVAQLPGWRRRGRG